MLRTPAQYIESLRDGRVVYHKGKQVPDVTAYPFFRVAIDHAAVDFAIPHDPEHRALAVTTDPDTGGEIARQYKLPASPDDLKKRVDIVDLGTRLGGTIVPLIKEIGTDAIFGLYEFAAQMDRAAGTHVTDRVRAFHRHCAANDLALCISQTDVKGDRSLRPSEQATPDMYLRIVERRSDGIVVRGAKMHTSTSVNANEVIVVPTRNMEESDRDYALSFATPINTPGLKLIASAYTPDHADPLEYPISAKHRMIETLTVFDNVFVPWERVFLDGQYQFAGLLATSVADHHRFTALAYKQPLVDLLVGSALLIADMNGISRYPHARDKAVWLMTFADILKSLVRVAADECHMVDPGIAVPNRLHVNVAKLYFGQNFHTALGCVQDLTGGLLVTHPSEADFQNPETREYIQKYLVGRKGVSASDRLKAIRMISDLTTSALGGYHAVLSIHAEGSIEAEKLAVLRAYDPKSAIDFARKTAGLEN